MKIGYCVMHGRFIRFNKDSKCPNIEGHKEGCGMKWVKNEGISFSEDNRFEISKATDRIHNGDWMLYDTFTKQTYYGQSLKHAKQIAEGYMNIR